MAKRVGVILSGCGRDDGSDVAEALLTLLIIERSGARAICAAPDVDQRTVVDHLTGQGVPGVRNTRVEAARIAGRRVVPLAALGEDDVDALVIPGGEGPIATLSDYPTKHELCQVDPQVVRLLRGLLRQKKPLGFVGWSALLAARVLGPVAGVRVTFGPKSSSAAKHAAIMGADVRPSTAADVIVDQKARVHTTAGFMAEGARLSDVARAIDRLVRSVVGGAKDRAPRAPTDPAPGVPGEGGEGAAAETTGPTRGSA